MRTPIVLSLVLTWVATGLPAQAPDTPAWWRSGVCYEVFVRSFQDSDGDGVGDLQGLIEKLDYVNDGDPDSRTDLGANCIWLMPVAQSPSYHGYDVTNYYAINRDYGTNEDFRRLVAEAGRRGIRILFDLVLNHTSSEHPHFRDALLDPESPFRDWYVWRPDPLEMPGWEAPTWHRVPGRDEYYFGLFWGGMPDLVLSNPQVKAEAERIARFWLEEMGVAGFRMDAVAHLFEDGGQWRHAAANHPWLRDYQRTLEGIDPEVFTVGEVYDDTDGVLAYYPDQLVSYFAFEVADGMIEAARSGRKETLVAAVERVERELPTGRYATFLRNHDQTRTMTDVGGDPGAARVAASLLLTLPGFPFVYYGEEIGMTGAKQDGDPRLRTPMHWSRTRGVGFTSGVPWEPLPSDSFAHNVEPQDEDPASLLNHYRELVHLRSADAALARGDFLDLDTGGEGAALAFLRRAGDERALVLVNLGDRPLDGVRVSSAVDALPAGSYRLTPLYGDAGPGALEVAEGGRIAAWTAPAIPGRGLHVLRVTAEP